MTVIDLHAHSTASDGTLSPTELVDLASAEGLVAIALTDHDTVAGLDEAERAALRQGIGFVPGIELEVEWDRGIFHMLGLGLERWDGEAGERLELAQTFRRERNLAMVDELRRAGIGIDYDELIDIAGHETVGRPHFAQWLYSHDVVSSMQEAFDSLIGDGRPCYVPKRGLSVGKTADAIHAAGGVAVVAHPQTLRMGWDELGKSLRRWKGEGLDGVEAYHSGITCNDGHRLAALADEVGLFSTAGSDFHGPTRSRGGSARSERRLGRSCDDMPIDDRFLEPLGRYAHAGD